MRCLAVTVLAALISTSLGQNQLTVQTKQGPVTGTLVTPGVRRFLGISYAVANRWEAPQPPPVRSTTLEATSFGDSCLQELNAFNVGFLNVTGLLNEHVQESEECLSVNIWAPSSNRKQGTAVMIWIYGGGFEFGTSNTIFYDGKVLVGNNDDVLLVTFNYRMNIFGFPNAPQLTSSSAHFRGLFGAPTNSQPPTSQNFGALDVAAAINWVHDNIAAFGGDPNRIILFGQSAGAALASSYKFSHPSDTIVKGIIEQSGTLVGMPMVVPGFGRLINPTPWNQVAGAVGCGTASTPAQLTCMKAVPPRTLENAVLSTNNDFVPVLDGLTFFADIGTRSAAGNFLRVPLLLGNTAEEGDIFLLGLEESAGNNPSLQSRLSIGPDIVTALVFSCPASDTAGFYVKASVPVWRYRYEAVFSDISSVSLLHAFHASEIPIVFGTYNLSTFGPPASVTEIALSKYVQGAWVAFARDPLHGLTNYGWPQFNPQTASLVRLGNSTNQTGAIFTTSTFFDNGCQDLGTQSIHNLFLIESNVIPCPVTLVGTGLNGAAQSAIKYLKCLAGCCLTAYGILREFTDKSAGV